MIDFKLSSFLSFCLLDTRFGSSSRLTRYASSDHGLFNPSNFEYLISKEKNERPKFGEDSFFFPFLRTSVPRRTFISDYPAIQFLSTSAVVFQDCVTWRDFVYFSRESLDITGMCVYIYTCVFSLSFFLPLFLGFYAPEKITFQHRGKNYFSRIELPLELRGQFMPTTLPTRSRGRVEFRFSCEGTPIGLPRLFLVPYARIIAANDETRGWFPFLFGFFIPFVSKKFDSQRIFF